MMQMLFFICHVVNTGDKPLIADVADIAVLFLSSVEKKNIDSAAVAASCVYKEGK